MPRDIKETVTETCCCGARIEITSEYPTAELKRFREAHSVCRSKPAPVVTPAQPWIPEPPPWERNRITCGDTKDTIEGTISYA